MELIYLYIRRYENVFEDVGFNFSSNYVTTLKNNQLLVEKNRSAIKWYYGKNINNVIMFLGQNGMGKSSLLDILGMNREDRIDDTYERQDKRRNIKSSYFMLYHLYDDYFGFEFVDDSFLNGEEKITNVDMLYEKVESALYKLPIGNIFKFENGRFLYCGNIMLQWLENQGVKNKVEYAYITSDRYNNRINNKYRRYNEDYFFERKYYLEENNYEYLYKYFIYLKEINNELLQEKSISVKNIIKIDNHIMDDDKRRGDYLYDRKKQLDKLFNLKSRIQIQMEEKLLKEKPEKDCRSMKDIFLQTFYAEAIEYYFLEQFVGWSENEGIKIDVDTPIPDVEDVEYEVKSLSGAEKETVDNGLMDIMNFQNEYAHLLYVIQKNTEVDGNINMKKVLQYVLNRVQNAAKNTIDILDKEAMLKIIVLLEGLPKHYFKSKRRIDIHCDVKKPDRRIIELLQWYDYYYRIRNEEVGGNNIFRLLNVELPKMSEGQRVFLDIISKAVSAIYAIKPEDSLVLLIDEPDRALHPELARKFLDTLLDSVVKCENRNIQVVLTSHSPFVVTDILPENVYAIDMDSGKRRIRNNNDTYATNIYYLLMDSFMLENTFGEHSYKKLKNIVELLSTTNEVEREELEWIKKIIDRIGEKTVKKKLLQLYKKKDTFKEGLVEQLLSETNETKIRKIKEILENHD